MVIIANIIDYVRMFNRFRKETRHKNAQDNKLRKNELARIASTIEYFLAEIKDIPVIVISYNNFSYVSQMIAQLNLIGIKPIVIDNASCDESSIIGLHGIAESGVASVVFSKFNFRHTVGFLDPIYEKLPKYFAYTDPDLCFSANLPFDFLTQLAKITDEFGVYKAGCALLLSVGNSPLLNLRNSISQKIPFEFSDEQTIIGWEEKYWKQKISHDLDLFSAQIDTTFAVYNKENYRGFFFDGIRVAGDFSAIHLPWFENLDPMSLDEREAYLEKNTSTTWKKA